MLGLWAFALTRSSFVLHLHTRLFPIPTSKAYFSLDEMTIVKSLSNPLPCEHFS